MLIFKYLIYPILYVDYQNNLKNIYSVVNLKYLFRGYNYSDACEYSI
jgi:hypothetical protein